MAMSTRRKETLSTCFALCSPQLTILQVADESIHPADTGVVDRAESALLFVPSGGNDLWILTLVKLWSEYENFAQGGMVHFQSASRLSVQAGA